MSTIPQHQNTAARGFSIVYILIALFVIAAIGLGGWYVWDRNREDDDGKPSNKTSQPKKEDQPKDTNEVVKQSDPSEGWQSYSNSKYGIEFRYPSDWRVDEVPLDPRPSGVDAEYAINVKHYVEIKYNNTLGFEIVGASLDALAMHYDGYFAQSSSSKVTRTTGQLKGKQSVQYNVSNGGATTKLYLFSVGSKTYALSSVNEEMNVQKDSAYWTKFDKVFDSVQIE